MFRLGSQSIWSITFVLGLVCAAPAGQLAQAQGTRDPAGAHNLDDPVLRDPAIARTLNDPANPRNLNDTSNARGLREDGDHRPLDDKGRKREVR